MALARSVAVKLVGEEAACLAAATTSSAGASFATNAEAPASSAANSCSSPAYIVSTTIPRSCPCPRISRTKSNPVPSGRRTSVITTSGWSVPNCLKPSATDAAWPATTKSSCRSKARARPCRMRSWSSISNTRRGSSVGSCVGPCVMGSATFLGQYGVVSNLNVHDRAAGPCVTCPTRDLDGCVDAVRPLAHDRDAVGVVAPTVDSPAVVAHGQRRQRGVGPYVDPQVVGGSVLARVGDCLLGDPQQLRLDCR